MSDEHATRRSAWGLNTNEPDENWRTKALCAQVDPEMFFPDKGGSTKDAKRVCLNCEVRAECLDDALATDDRFGVRGGLSERERRKLKQQLTPRPPRARPVTAAQCGTEAGAKAHAARHEKACDACKQAATLARHQRRERATA